MNVRRQSRSRALLAIVAFVIGLPMAAVGPLFLVAGTAIVLTTKDGLTGGFAFAAALYLGAPAAVVGLALLGVARFVWRRRLV